MSDVQPPPRGPNRLPWVILTAVALLAALGGGILLASRQPVSATIVDAPTTPVSTTQAPTPSASPSPSPTPYVPPSYAKTGPGTYVYATGQSPVFGTAGGLRTYRVAIETGIPVSAEDFAALVDETLGDARSWTAGADVRLQRVSGDTSASFTVLLVTPGTAEKLCNEVGLGIEWHGEPYTSCQAGQKAVINLSRYLTSVPNYGAPLHDYQQYAVNHEVGHVLGHGHELCPGKGQPAPVMQQQTFGLQGCTANSWPYLDGKRYAGPPGRVVPTDN